MTDTASEMAAASAELSAAESSEGSLPSSEPSQAESPPATSQDGSPTSEGTGTAEAQPIPGSVQPEGSKPRGPLPYERHEAILKNTRETYETQLKELEWAKGQNPAQITQMRQLYEWADRDPVGFHKFFGQQLEADPRYAAKPTAPVVEDLRPEPDVLLEDGRMVYSGEAMEQLLGWRERQFEKKTAAEYGPIKESFQHQQVMQQARQEATGVLTDARTWPGFSENEKGIRDLMASDGRITLDSAYRRVVVSGYQKKDSDVRASVRQEVLTELKNRSAGSTTNPGSSSVDPPKSYKGMSTDDIMRAVHRELAG